MRTYKNKQGNSGVRRFEITDDALIVEFVDGAIYEYNTRQPGLTHLRRMKELAEDGQGLATYINQHVRKDFARQLK